MNDITKKILEIKDYEENEMTAIDMTAGIMSYMLKKGLEKELEDEFYKKEENLEEYKGMIGFQKLKDTISHVGLLEFDSVLDNLPNEDKINFIEGSAETIGYHYNEQYNIAEFAGYLEFAGEKEYNDKVLGVVDELRKKIKEVPNELYLISDLHREELGSCLYITDAEKLVEIKQIDNPYTQILEKKDEVLRELTREFIEENITKPNDIADKIKEKFAEVNFDENKIEAMDNKIFYTVNDVIKNEYKELLKDKEKGKEKEEIEY